MSTACQEDVCPWGSRRLYLLALLSQTLGTPIFTSLPNSAIMHGATGYMLGYVLAFIFIGIPLFYMEYIISQFTARNCIDVWRIRPCLTHIGYVQIICQFFLIIYNHTLTSFLIHYFFISFENPIPYYTCGSWSTKVCNIANYNYSINQECIKLKESFSYCEDLHTTFPEYEYWRYYILGSKASYYYVAWRVCLASGIACALSYLSCFKRKASLKWFICFFTIYPIFGYFILMIGSMMQKGLVVKFEEALDTNFSIFVRKYTVSDIIQQVLYTLNIGTGVSFNLGSTTSFRAPCYSNVVITVFVCAALTVLIVSTVAMMTCPYSFEYNTKPSDIMSLRLSLVFERSPRLLSQFEHQILWLILNFSCNAVLALSTTVIVILSLLETLGSKCAMINKYNGLVTFGFVIVIFLVTTPLLGKNGVYLITDFRRYVTCINILIGIIESLVFVAWYGLDKFCEDVHFMQGIQPKSFMKLSWMLSSVVLAYVFCSEFYHDVYASPSGTNLKPYSTLQDLIGRWSLIVLISLIVLVTLGKLAVAAAQKKFLEAIALDPMWGPRSEVLMRSRAMFSAHAMTKEYMYRQYHLQAGILARQKASNIRRERDV